MSKIKVVRKGELAIEAATQGIVREKAFEAENFIMTRSRVAGGVTSGWHHHGERDLYGYLVSGRLRIEYGQLGRGAIELSAGDFLHIPARMVHRDLNLQKEAEAVVLLTLVGTGPPIVNVEGPER